VAADALDVADGVEPDLRVHVRRANATRQRGARLGLVPREYGGSLAAATVVSAGARRAQACWWHVRARRVPAEAAGAGENPAYSRGPGLRTGCEAAGSPCAAASRPAAPRRPGPRRAGRPRPGRPGPPRPAWQAA